LNYDIGFLIHELAHAAARKGDLAIYNKLTIAGLNLPLATKVVTTGKGKRKKSKTVNDYSQTISDFFNNNCK